jgi:hypothetical protein
VLRSLGGPRLDPSTAATAEQLMDGLEEEKWRWEKAMSGAAARGPLTLVSESGDAEGHPPTHPGVCCKCPGDRANMLLRCALVGMHCVCKGRSLACNPPDRQPHTCSRLLPHSCLLITTPPPDAAAAAPVPPSPSRAPHITALGTYPHPLIAPLHFDSHPQPKTYTLRPMLTPAPASCPFSCSLQPLYQLLLIRKQLTDILMVWPLGTIGPEAVAAAVAAAMAAAAATAPAAMAVAAAAAQVACTEVAEAAATAAAAAAAAAASAGGGGGGGGGCGVSPSQPSPQQQQQQQQQVVAAAPATISAQAAQQQGQQVTRVSPGALESLTPGEKGGVGLRLGVVGQTRVQHAVCLGRLMPLPRERK